ncbi:hypothetical protein RND71_027706 [Anisodus tanguticus]|uniref:Cyclin-like domain-containing protein n=1 Tax=Anisodus tanguticus TaxID=243964 RepID=A0AAE1RJS2_9SOLA|nr:hypothetical protein RND71_027706 [Anisodus tanguticus]
MSTLGVANTEKETEAEAVESCTRNVEEEESSEIINDDWIQEARTHGIHYILRTGQELRFGMQTIYTSVIYLDRFLATRTIEIGEYWAVRLLSVGCLSLAAKMDENRGNLPALSQYPVRNYDINPNEIIRMELLLLDVLNWDMSCVTPFTFKKYFVSRCCRENSRKHNTRMRIVEIIMSVFKVMFKMKSLIKITICEQSVTEYCFNIENRTGQWPLQP